MKEEEEEEKNQQKRSRKPVLARAWAERHSCAILDTEEMEQPPPWPPILGDRGSGVFEERCPSQERRAGLAAHDTRSLVAVCFAEAMQRVGFSESLL